MVEPILALKWLNGILRTDPVLNHVTTGVLGGFHRKAPATARYPYGIFRQHMSSSDVTGLENAVKIWTPMVFQVNVYDAGRDDFSRLDPLANRIYALLHAARATLADGIIYGSQRSGVDAGDTVVGSVVELYITQKFTIDAYSNP
jgi:hypothetical protein